MAASDGGERSPAREPPGGPATRARIAAGVMLASTGGFVALLALAVASYPGGSWFDRRARGFHPLRNFLSDLLAPVALDGTPSPVAARASLVAMVCLDVALALSFLYLPRLFFPAHAALGRWVRGSGLACAVALLGVPLIPPSQATRFGGHAAAIFVGGLPAVVAVVLAVHGLRAGRAPRRFLLLGGALVALVVVALVLFARYLATGGDPPLALPVLERPAALLLVAWLSAIAVRLGRAHAR